MKLYKYHWIGITGIMHFYINSKASEECFKTYTKNKLYKLINPRSLSKVRRPSNFLRIEYNALNKINKNILLAETKKNNNAAFNKFKKNWIPNQNYINWNNSGKYVPFTLWKQLGLKLKNNTTWTNDNRTKHNLLFGRAATNQKNAEQRRIQNNNLPKRN